MSQNQVVCDSDKLKTKTKIGQKGEFKTNKNKGNLKGVRGNNALAQSIEKVIIEEQKKKPKLKLKRRVPVDICMYPNVK